jgi:pyruvate/2-oxoglutarate/acetoin dehydrogenase E1 component
VAYSPPTQVLADALRRDPRVVMLSAFPIPFWTEEFGPARIRTYPISEHAMVGMGVGMAMAGFRPVVHLARAAFAFTAMDQLVNQAGKLRYLWGGQVQIPLIVRALSRGPADLLAGQHEQSPYAVFMHFPTLRVAVPASLEDAAGLYLTALEEDEPTLVFEPPAIYAGWSGEPVRVSPVAFGIARTWRRGRDVTVVAIGSMVTVALRAAELLEREGISAEVIDPRTLSPLDLETVKTSVARTGRLAVVDEAASPASAGAEILARVVEDAGCLRHLSGPCLRIAGSQFPAPFERRLYAASVPAVEGVVSGLRAYVRREMDVGAGGAPVA